MPSCKFCCNPLGKKNHARVSKAVSRVNDEFRAKFPEEIGDGKFICKSCHTGLKNKKKTCCVGSKSAIDNYAVNNCVACVSEEVSDNLETLSRSSDSGHSHQEFEPDEEEHQQIIIEALNRTLPLLGQAIIPSDWSQRSGAEKRKTIDGIKEAIDKTLNPEDYSSEIECIIKEIEEKLKNAQTPSEKIKLLTMLPKSWSISKIQKTFNVSYYTARRAYWVHQEDGIGASLPKRTRRSSVSMTTKQLVEEFYRNDEISRVMPGKKDCISVKIDGVRQNVQKRLMLANLKEVYASFKEKFPDVQIGFSKFAEFRPDECRLPHPHNGTHTVCVCKIHQNVKLKLLGIKAFQLPDSFNSCSFPKDYSQVLSAMMCDNPTPLCHLGECPECPGARCIELHLQEICDENSIDSVTYMTWTATDRSELIKRTEDTNSFISNLCTDLIALRQHDFIAKSQHNFLNQCKADLKPGEFIILSDFAENYHFIIQDAVQGYHWTKDQVTLHPIVVYYRDDTELKHDSFVIISESLNHDTIAVHLFLRKVINILKSKYSSVGKIFHFSDGASSQYKNRKNFINLVYHESDFGVRAEWHFFATSHGKSPCDGIGGTLKRAAARASLQRPYDNQIKTPRELYEFAKESMNLIQSIFCTKEEHAVEEEALKTRFDKALPITGTRQFHCYLPIANTHSLKCKIHSLDDEFEIRNVAK